MANGIRTGDSRGFSKDCSSKFHEGSQVRQTPATTGLRTDQIIPSPLKNYIRVRPEMTKPVFDSNRPLQLRKG